VSLPEPLFLADAVDLGVLGIHPFYYFLGLEIELDRLTVPAYRPLKVALQLHLEVSGQFHVRHLLLLQAIQDDRFDPIVLRLVDVDPGLPLWMLG